MPDPSEPPYAVVLTRSARRALARLPPPIYENVVRLLDGDLATAPRRVGKPLGPPYEGQLSARRGDPRRPYRLRYEVDEQTRVVTVVDVDHRGHVYH